MTRIESGVGVIGQSFLRFALAGIIGFFVDASALTLALSWGIDHYSGRAFSFLCAVTVTWYMNRIYTFSSQDPRLLHEWGRFVSANAIGGLMNYMTYAALVSSTGLFATYPVAAVGAGSLAGMLWNFTLSHRLVFMKSSSPSHEKYFKSRP